ncbi:MAG: nickel pincer cofactor biosynthesis protein LarC [Clostridium sp.]|nr:nickel pincer cofactor biosynthesis protein LarC [Clostridium sp.]MDU3119541.1 nickel pincer cofactor biosynthesis protein LarC [Clostridium sp.]
MRTIYLDCGMGAAGDMLMAALLELCPEKKEEFLGKMNGLGLPGVKVEAEPAVKCGITGTHMNVTVFGEEEESEDVHDHGHAHTHSHEACESIAADGLHSHVHSHDGHGHSHHHHHHSTMAGIASIIDGLDIPAPVKEDMKAVYALIAEAESHAHGTPVDQIHFHEVGTMDAVADIAGVCLLFHELGADQIIASPVHVGSGHVHCAHGILPVPAPATAHILQGIPVYSTQVQGELCTPTGAALLKHFVKEFREMPVMTTSKIGYGMGKKDFERANCVRAFLGDTAETGDEIAELSCNLDDMTAEAIGFAEEALFEAGALEVYTIPVGMKKSRPGILLTCMCRREDEEKMVELLFRHTTTLGVREHISRRFTLKRREETVETAYGPVRKKISQGHGVTRAKLEYEDLAAIAKKTGRPLEEIRKEIEK